MGSASSATIQLECTTVSASLARYSLHPLTGDVVIVVVSLRFLRPEQLARPEGFKNLVEYLAVLRTPTSPFLPSEWSAAMIMNWLLRVADPWPVAMLWGGAAYNPQLGYVFVNTMDEASIGWMELRTGRNGQRTYARNSIVGSTSRFQWHDSEESSGGNIQGSGQDAWPCQKPPWGNLVAVNARTGDIAWRVPLGITEELPQNRQRTGRLNMGGPITTASGLLFIGASNDLRFRAFDSRTGKELWVTKLAMSAHAVPITYGGRNGKQYVSILPSGRSALNDDHPE